MADQLDAPADATVNQTDTAADNTTEALYPQDNQEGGDPSADAEVEQVEGEQAESEQETADETPAVEPPNSWSKEDAEHFKTLTPEAQAVVLRRESERDRFVKQKEREAVEARTSAQSEARQALVQIQQNTAQQLEQYAQMFAPQPPDPRLLSTGQEQDRTLFYQMEAQFRSDTVQQQRLQQEAEQARQLASHAEQAQIAAVKQQGEQILAEKLGSDWTEPSRRQKLLTDLESIGGELGYSAELMANADATDILGLKMALTWKQDADKWRDLQKRKMVPVRAAKQPPQVTQPGVAGGARTNQPQSVAAMLYPNDAR